MPRENRTWTGADVSTLIQLREIDRATWHRIGLVLDRTADACEMKFTMLRRPPVTKPMPGVGGKTAEAGAIATREAQRALQHASLTAAVFGDPLPGRSALDRRHAR